MLREETRKSMTRKEYIISIRAMGEKRKKKKITRFVRCLRLSLLLWTFLSRFFFHCKTSKDYTHRRTTGNEPQCSNSRYYPFANALHSISYKSATTTKKYQDKDALKRKWAYLRVKRNENRNPTCLQIYTKSEYSGYLEQSTTGDTLRLGWINSLKTVPEVVKEPKGKESLHNLNGYYERAKEGKKWRQWTVYQTT